VLKGKLAVCVGDEGPPYDKDVTTPIWTLDAGKRKREAREKEQEKNRQKNRRKRRDRNKERDLRRKLAGQHQLEKRARELQIEWEMLRKGSEPVASETAPTPKNTSTRCGASAATESHVSGT
jgi:hypothetical protein